MKIKDLPKDKNLGGIKIRIPKKYQDKYMKIPKEGYWVSQWNNGIFIRKNKNDKQVL